ncbi:hypothetical protein BDW02DRAFT_573738 [Decorospora gaudefroyi]|uniref:Extracellular membrane protein CFEM domain-containing protein n=1 Tax=Decorospora gaudefroyi TaxID=184978 RepID=A0A6A5JZ12_9PLEO|nr:hypothetical protein BDW02DRAFT_573738 [Decorospora gaudefroyi]
MPYKTVAFLLSYLLVASGVLGQQPSILDLEEAVRNSKPYIGLNNLCAQCALAGARGNSGCWSYDAGSSTVHQSNCLDGQVSCFCASDKLQERADYTRKIATEICDKHGPGGSVLPDLTAKAYLDFCNATMPTSVPSDSPPSGSEGLNDEAKIGLGVGLGLGIPTLAVTCFMAWVAWKYRRANPQGYTFTQIINNHFPPWGRSHGNDGDANPGP